MVLAALASFDATEGEKLRWFAIWLEEHELPAWSVLGAVYAEAVRRAPDDARVLHARAVATLQYAGGTRP